MHDETEALARLTGYLRALLSSGQPLPEGLAALSASLAGRHEKELLARIGAEVAAGTPLSAAVAAALGRGAPPLLTTLLRAGEASGRLGDAVDALARYYGTQRDLARQVSTALLYPRVAGMVMIAVVFPTLAWVQRQLSTDPGFATGRESSPLALVLDGITRVLLFPFGFGPAVTALVIAVAALAVFGGIPPLDRLVTRLTRELVAAGSLRRAATAAAVARGLALLQSAGVPVPDALRLLAGCTADVDARKQLEAAAARAESGLSAGQALQGVTALPPSFAWFLSLGPTQGLEEAARFYEDEARERAQLMAQAAQPLIVMALAVAFLPSATVLARLLTMVGSLS